VYENKMLRIFNNIYLTAIGFSPGGSGFKTEKAGVV
jgi:hypothetical protein